MLGRFSIHTRLRRAAGLQLVAALVTLSLQVGCQPKDARPGLWLRGQASETSATDWSFAADMERWLKDNPDLADRKKRKKSSQRKRLLNAMGVYAWGKRWFDRDGSSGDLKTYYLKRPR